jgi:hypothetical protein
MTTTPHAAAAAAARQRLANVLGTLQQNPNVPASVLEILSGLARAMGPLFQLERGSTDLSQFQTARTVLQETLEKIQVADQSFPGVAEATEAVATTLGMIFKAMRDAGLVPGGGGQPQAQPQQPVAAANPMPVVSQPAQPQPFAMPPQQQPPQSFAMPQQPQHAQAQPFAAQPPQQQPQAQPFALQQPRAAQPQAAPQQAPFAQPSAAAAQRPAASAAKPHAPSAAATPGVGSVPVGPNGLPRLESEIGVHSETNFYTDFLGDIRANGGIFVATFHVLPIGSQCEVVLTFPGNLTAEFRGVVRWKRENVAGVSMTSSPGLGIQIAQADAAAWDLIERFIRKREPIMHEM